MSQSKRHPTSKPLLSMKEKPRVALTLVLVSPNILLLSKSVLSKWGSLRSLEARTYHQTRGCQGKLVPQSIDSHSWRHCANCWCASRHIPPLKHFQGPAGSSALPICTWCFPQPVPNCLVSWIFYCNFLCLIYFKVAKCFHKEKTVQLFRNEDSKTPVSFVSVLGSV